MRLIFTILLSGILFAGTSQTFQGSLRPGTQANSAFCALRSSANFTGNPTNIQFTLAVPRSVGTRPTLTILNNLYSAQFAANGVTIIQTASTANDYIYLINFSIALFQSRTYVANTPDNVVEISFQGNTASTNNLRLVQLPDGLASSGAGGENGQYNFYVEYQGVDRTNTAAMFYTANGGTVTNDPNGYTGSSSVSLGSSIVLPVRFSSFTAMQQASGALLRWTIEQQQDVASYTVQAIVNGVVTNVASIPSALGGTYVFNDVQFNNYSSSKVLYRVLAMQRDGTPVYSNYALLSKGAKGNVQLVNAQNISQALLSFGANKPGAATMQVFTIDGKMLYQQTKQVEAGQQQWPIHGYFQKGNYVVRAIVNNQSITFQAIQP